MHLTFVNVIFIKRLCFNHHKCIVFPKQQSLNPNYKGQYEVKCHPKLSSRIQRILSLFGTKQIGVNKYKSLVIPSS